MKKTFYQAFLFTLGFCGISQAQLDSIQKLDEIILSDSKLKNYAEGIKIQILNDSVINKNVSSLTGLLALNSNIYFKENGFGMVSSPSFRGTGASQTAVIWNGININSQRDGQTDFNTISSIGFNSVDIRSGGGSVQYGSGAIGGSIHLNNILRFNKHFDNAFKLSYGSFDTKSISYLSSFGDKKISGNIGVAYLKSENDYKYLGTDQVNENGAFKNLNLNVNLGYSISDKDVLKLYHQSAQNDRLSSGTLVARSRNKLLNDNYRSMLEWVRISGVFSSKFRVAHLKEHFKFFENKDKNNYSFGDVNTLLFNHSLNVRLSKKLQFKTIVDYSDFKGDGSNFGNKNRSVFSSTFLLKHKPTKKLGYGINIRKDFTSGFKSPLVFSLDTGYSLSKYYKIQVNGSKNYRVPTFNDLYWQPGGNLDLVPESSYQLDVGQQFIFKYFNIKLNTYYINTQDLIQWRPNSGGVWSPINVAEVENYGGEFELESHYTINRHRFNVTTHYSYTVAQNKATKQQLIYVPFHKGNMALSYNYKAFSAFYQHLFNGEVFKIDRKPLMHYDIGNLGVSYKFKKNKKMTYDIDFKINNLYNKYYENVGLRPMPNRNFNIQLTLKF